MPTIRSATDRIQATVAAFSQIKQSQFNEGTFQSVLFEGDGLPDGKIWRSMSPDDAQSFTRGQRVYLVPTTNKQGKPSYDIELIDAPSAPTAPATAPTTAPQAPQAPQQGMTADQKRQVAAFVEDQASLLKFCRDTVIAKFGDADEETIRCSTTTLYLSASRKFQLDR